MLAIPSKLGIATGQCGLPLLHYATWPYPEGVMRGQNIGPVTTRVAGSPARKRRNDGNMPKLKTHKGIKKRFKVSANGKVKHKRCGSSHLMSHKSGKQVRRLRKKSILAVSKESKKMRRAIHTRESSQPLAIEAARLASLTEESPEVDLAK